MNSMYLWHMFNRSNMEDWKDYWLCYTKLPEASWKEWNIPVEPPAWGVDK